MTLRNSSNRSTRQAARLVAALGLTMVPGAMIVALPDNLSAQEIRPVQAPGRITGTVTGGAGEPVAGAQVSIPALRVGAVTDTDGRFNIPGVAAGTYELRAQRIGFAPSTQQVTVAADGIATANFTLTPIATTLSTQVVVGYTTQQRRDVSDATAGVTGEELRDQKVATVEEALRGRVPGVQIAASGEPGRPAQVIIRGQAFLNGNLSPLYVVDGMYMTQNPNINPDDIESIEVLKDASAAAQYGAQAANGVIVIQTKKGRPGANRVELQSYYGTQDIPKRIDLMSSSQWAALQLQAYQNAGTPTADIPAGVFNPTVNTDWQDEVFQQGHIQNHNLSVSGGSENGRYLLSGGFLDQTGAILNTDFRRYSFRVNSEATRGRFTVGENIALSQGTRNGLAGFALIDVVRLIPAIPVRDPDNEDVGGFGFGSDALPTFGVNPVAMQESRERFSRSNQVVGTAYAQVALPANFRYRFNVGLNYNDGERRDFNSIAQIRYREGVPFATLNSIRDDFTSLLFENLLSYDNSFRDGMHRFNAVAGYTEQKQSYDSLWAYREGFTFEDLRTIGAGLANRNNNGGRLESALRGLLFRANYTLMDRYLFTGSVRRDESSRFSPGNRTANFAAASAGWVLSEEGFYRNLTGLSNRINYVKLRASTGVLGNQDIPEYQYSAPVTQTLNYLFGGGTVNTGAIQLGLANPNIRWQSNRSHNLGLDMGLLNDRFTLTADYYVSTSEGILIGAPLPPSIGSDVNPFVNAGSVRNAGVELGLTNRLERGIFRLNTTGTLTTTKNRVLRLGRGNQPLFDQTGAARTAVYDRATGTGGQIGEFYVLQTAGLFQSDADVAAHTTTVNGTVRVLQPNAKAGDLRFVDRNRDGLINLDDRYDAGNGIPDFTYGLFFDGGVSQFDFKLNLRGAQGGEIFNVVRYWTDRGDDPGNFRTDYRPWTPTNTNTSTPRIVFGPAGAQNATFLSDRWIEDGSFLRIQNVEVGYRLPTSLWRGLGLGDVESPRVYLNVQNLHTFTDFSNWDPETLGYGNPLGRGIDDGLIFPNVRTWTFGVDLRL